MVELITVVVIIGILAAVTAPRFFTRSVFDSRGFYDQVISTLRYAQKSAIAQRGFVCVAFSANSVTLTTGTTAACGTPLAGPTGTAPYTVSSSQTTFSGGVAPLPATFYFDALGRAVSPPGSISVDGYASSITIEAETGYVH